jgi:hypothetical protein
VRVTLRAGVLENAAPASMGGEPVFSGAFLYEDGNAVGEFSEFGSKRPLIHEAQLLADFTLAY